MSRNLLRFIKECMSMPRSTGAIAPSSRFLARRMVCDIGLEQAETVIEYGPGTGSFTRAIKPLLKQGAHFFAVELNAGFVRSFVKRHPDVPVHQDTVCNIRAICDVRKVEQADCIVSGLPWSVFPDELQTEILDAMMTVLRPGGSFSTFAYVHGLLLPGARRFRSKLDHYFSQVTPSSPVWLNLPPAICYACVR